MFKVPTTVIHRLQACADNTMQLIKLARHVSIASLVVSLPAMVSQPITLLHKG